MAIATNHLSKYVLRLFNYEGQEIYVLTDKNIVSLEYTRILNDVGTFSVALIGKQAEWVWENIPLPVGLDYMLEVYRMNPNTEEYEKDETFFVRFVNPYHTDDGTFFVVIGGYSLNRLLMYRLLVPDEDPLGAGGYITDAGRASRVIERLVNAHLAKDASRKRKIPNFTVHADDTGENAGGRWRFDNLLEICTELANVGGIQFGIEHLGGAQLRMNIGTIGRDMTVETNFPGHNYTLFSRMRGNLSEPSLVLDYQEEKNVVYTRGSGNDENENVIVQEAIRADSSPYNRIEFEHTATRDDETKSPTILLTKAKDALYENAPKIEFTFPVQDLAGTLYKVNYDLGDKVTAIWGDFNNSLRISEISLSVQEGNETLAVAVESDELGRVP